MTQILSQDEVDALLTGVAGGDVAPETPSENDESKPYDLVSQSRVVRGRMPGMDIINEKFLRSLKGDLSNAMRRPVEFVNTKREVLRYAEFINRLHVPSNVNIFSLEPLEGYGVLILEANLVFSLVNCFFGGAAGFHSKVEGREFTQIEQKIINNIVRMMLRDYEAAWAQGHPLNLSYIRSEINPSSAGICDHTETLIVHQFDIEIDGQVDKMFIGIPYPALEPISEKLFSGFVDSRSGAERWRSYFEKKLQDSSLGVTVELGKETITLRELMDLQVGDIIQLDLSPEEPIDVLVEGIQKYIGLPGVANGSQAVKIAGVHEGGFEE
jgi:flagellar motor switch protein FliM